MVGSSNSSLPYELCPSQSVSELHGQLSLTRQRLTEAQEDAAAAGRDARAAHSEAVHLSDALRDAAAGRAATQGQLATAEREAAEHLGRCRELEGRLRSVEQAGQVAVSEWCRSRGRGRHHLAS
jgi:hypothetical protein